MSMLDYVNFKCKCPRCDSVLDGFQTKDGEPQLAHVDFWTVNNFYTLCSKCECWIELNLKPSTHVKPLSAYSATVTLCKADEGYEIPIDKIKVL